MPRVSRRWQRRNGGGKCLAVEGKGCARRRNGRSTAVLVEMDHVEMTEPVLLEPANELS